MPTLPKIRVVCAAICEAGRYLISQRSAQAVLPLLWEFPGGRVEAGETDAAALQRELRHRLGLEAQVEGLICCTERAYDSYVVSLFLYRCRVGPKAPQPLRVRAMRWVRSDEFDQLSFTPADQTAMDSLLFGTTPALQPSV